MTGMRKSRSRPAVAVHGLVLDDAVRLHEAGIPVEEVDALVTTGAGSHPC